MAGIITRKCCCATCLTGGCANCIAGSVPDNFTITVDGIDYTTNAGICYAVTPTHPGIAGMSATPNDPNGTRCAFGSFGGGCAWQAVIIAGGDANEWSPDCTGTIVSGGNVMLFYLTKLANKWTMEIRIISSGTMSAWLFYGEIVTADPVRCDAPLSFTNLLGAPGGDSPVIGDITMGAGGTVDAVACCP